MSEDDLRRNHIDHRFLSRSRSISPALGNAAPGVLTSSSGVRRLPDPSEEAEEPVVRPGRMSGGLFVSTGVLGALAARVIERILGKRGAGAGRRGSVEWEWDEADATEADAEAFSEDLPPPRPRELNADAMERIVGSGGS